MLGEGGGVVLRRGEEEWGVKGEGSAKGVVGWVCE